MPMPTFLLLAAADTRRRRCVTLAHRRNNGEIVVSIFTTFNKTVFFYKLNVYLPILFFVYIYLSINNLFFTDSSCILSFIKRSKDDYEQ
jgi:hypothetical protein